MHCTLCFYYKVVDTTDTTDYALEGYKLQWSNCTLDIDLKFTEHVSKILHIDHSMRATLVLKCFQADNPEESVKTGCSHICLTNVILNNAHL